MSTSSFLVFDRIKENLKHQQKHTGTQIKKKKLSNRRREETEVPYHVVV